MEANWLIAGFAGTAGAAIAGWMRFQDIKKDKPGLSFDFSFYVNSLVIPVLLGFAFGAMTSDPAIAFSTGMLGKIGVEAFKPKV